ncbi:hypothetical protein, partial [Desulfoluna sp.]|uniref:hypothetical protein n=1 Tax=Desulfoluna sp. TaxID=2045199 RepID=UPI00262CDB17
MPMISASMCGAGRRPIPAMPITSGYSMDDLSMYHQDGVGRIFCCIKSGVFRIVGWIFFCLVVGLSLVPSGHGSGSFPLIPEEPPPLV